MVCIHRHLSAVDVAMETPCSKDDGVELFLNLGVVSLRFIE